MTLTPGGDRGGTPSTLDLSKRRDLRMIKQALLQRWDVPADARPALAKAVAQVVDCDAFSVRHRTTAMEILVLMMQRNIEARDAASAIDSVPS